MEGKSRRAVAEHVLTHVSLTPHASGVRILRHQCQPARFSRLSARALSWLASDPRPWSSSSEAERETGCRDRTTGGKEMRSGSGTAAGSNLTTIWRRSIIHTFCVRRQSNRLHENEESLSRRKRHRISQPSQGPSGELRKFDKLLTRFKKDKGEYMLHGAEDPNSDYLGFRSKLVGRHHQRDLRKMFREIHRKHQGS